MPDFASNLSQLTASAVFRRVCVVLFACLCLSTVATADGGDRKAPKAAVAKKTTVSKPAPLTSDQEDSALRFAREHHPELANLLTQLRDRSPKGFARGIREIHMAAERMERVREKQPARFEAELQNWKLDSEIRLLTARWAMSRDPELEQQIRELLRRRQVSRIDRLKNERDRLAERLQQLDNQIGMGTAELEADLIAEWDRLSRRAQTTATARKK